MVHNKASGDRRDFDALNKNDAANCLINCLKRCPVNQGRAIAAHANLACEFLCVKAGRDTDAFIPSPRDQTLRRVGSITARWSLPFPVSVRSAMRWLSRWA